nr:uracil nucleotide/cysteinyl leukotriene receptor-like [Misgurnus anguillicaudatus]
MDNSAMNFTTPEVSTNSTSPFIGLISCVDSLIIFISSINVLFGLPTHSYIIWLIYTETKSGIASRLFNLNLSVCEIGNCLNALLQVLSCLFSNITRATHFLQGLGTTARPLFQCLICVERYLAVVHPVTFLKFKPLRYKVICCTAAWIVSLISCLCCIFILVSLYTFTWFFSIQFLIFLFIQLFCCLAVLRALKQSGPGERGREREEENHMKKKAFYLILITTGNMVILYVPYIISGFIIILTKLDNIWVWFPATVCYVLAGFIHPVLYLHRAGKFSCLCSV